MARGGSFALVALPIALAVIVVGAASACCRSPAPADTTPGASETSVSITTPGDAKGPAAARPTGPPTPPPPPRLDRPLRVMVGGDLLPHRPSLLEPAAVRAALAPLGSLFAQADAVVANYEAATGDVDPRASRLAYAAPRGWLDELPKAGIRAVTIANNHACDLGEPGLAATLDGAAKSGLLALGGGGSDPWAPRIIVEQGGKRICAVSWTTLSNAGNGACASGRHLAIAPLSGIGKQRIDLAMKRARAECDATIAIFHGGNEYEPQTTMVMDQAAHAAEAGADAVVIHHPHVASPVVVHATRDGRNVPLFASVGNLVTNQGESWKPPMFPVLAENRRLVCVNGWTRLGVLADLAFSFTADDSRPRLDWTTHLVWIDNEHATDRSVATPKIEARLLDPVRDRAIVDTLGEDVRGPRALFSDPCWSERSPAATRGGAPERDPRCSSVQDPSATGPTISSPAAGKGRASRHHVAARSTRSSLAP